MNEPCPKWAADEIRARDAEIKNVRAALQDARDMAVGWMLTADRLTPEQAVENVKRFDAILKQN